MVQSSLKRSGEPSATLNWQNKLNIFWTFVEVLKSKEGNVFRKNVKAQILLKSSYFITYSPPGANIIWYHVQATIKSGHYMTSCEVVGNYFMPKIWSHTNLTFHCTMWRYIMFCDVTETCADDENFYIFLLLYEKTDIN